MRKAIIQLFKENQVARHIVAAVLLISYIAIYCLLSFSDYLSYSAIAMDDYSHNAKLGVNDEIMVIGITKSDLEKYEYGSSELAAQVANHIVSNSKPSVVALDIDVSTILFCYCIK